MNALAADSFFSARNTKNLLCLWHINKNIQTNCKRGLSSEMWSEMAGFLQRMWAATSEDHFKRQWRGFRDYCGVVNDNVVENIENDAFPDDIDHTLRNPNANIDRVFMTNEEIIEDSQTPTFANTFNSFIAAADVDNLPDITTTTNPHLQGVALALRYKRIYAYVSKWLPFTKYFVKYYVDKHFHIGNITSSRGEGSHSHIKSFLSSSRGDLMTVHTAIKASGDRLWTTWMTSIATEAVVIDEKHRNDVYLGNVVLQITSFALKKVHHQHLLLQGRQKRKADGKERPDDLRRCTGGFYTSMGMPCSHMLQTVNGKATALQKTDFHPHHWIDHLIVPRAATYAYYGVVPASPPSKAAEIPLLSIDDVKPFLQALPTMQQHQILQTVREAIKRPILQPDVVVHGKGRPVGALGKTYNAKHSLQDLFDIANSDGTTKRFKSAHELTDVDDEEVSLIPSSMPPPPSSQRRCGYCKIIGQHDARNCPVKKRQGGG